MLSGNSGKNRQRMKREELGPNFGKRLSSGDFNVKSFRSQSSREVDRVVRRINNQYEKLMNDVQRYKSSVETGPPLQTQ